MMYAMDTTTMKALHEQRRERLAGSARPRRYRQRRPPRRRLAALLASSGPQSSDGRQAHGRTVEGCSTGPAAAA